MISQDRVQSSVPHATTTKPQPSLGPARQQAMVIIMFAAWITMAVGLVAVLWWLLRAAGGRQAPALSRVLRTHGAQRCQAALALLRLLAMGADEARIAAAWQRLEAPLAEALPDCPPHLTQDLAIALDDLHGCCRNRALQRQIMDLRNAVLDDNR